MSSRFSGPGVGRAGNERCTTPADHARRASDLLAGVDAVERQLSELTPDEHLLMAVNGGFTQSNRNVEHTIALAHAHALTALALALA